MGVEETRMRAATLLCKVHVTKILIIKKIIIKLISYYLLPQGFFSGIIYDTGWGLFPDCLWRSFQVMNDVVTCA